MKDHVIHVSPCYVNFEEDLGGLSNVVRDLSSAQSEIGLAVTVICINIEGGKIFDQPEHRRFGDVDIFTYDSKRVLRSIIRSINNIARISKTSKTCTLHLHGYFQLFSDASAIIASRFLNLPLVITPHGRFSKFQMKNKMRRKLVWLMASKIVIKDIVTNITYFTKSDQLQSHRLHNIKEHIIPNGINNPPAFSKNTGGDDYILYIGRIEEIKNIELIVDAFLQSTHTEELKLIIAGPDNTCEATRLKKKVQQLETKENRRIEFIGKVTGTRKWDLIYGARLVVLPSRSEGMPGVLLEALACGVPSVFSSGCNMSVVAERGAGREVKTYDVDSWKRVLEEIIIDEEWLSNASKAAREAARDYSWRRVSILYRDVYNSSAQGQHDY